jgi:hypothetical protein
MRIGIVDRLLLDQKGIMLAIAHGSIYRPPTERLKDHLLRRGAEVSVAETIAGLAELGNLSEYDAFLIHPGIGRQRETIQRIRDEAPGSLLAIITFNVDDYVSENGASIFSLNSKNYDRIYDFLEESLKREKG